MPMEERVLGLYDFRSKQEYIYKTNRMREITGASDLIAGMYDEFLKREPLIRNKWEHAAEIDDDFSDGSIGEVVYIGGGNLVVLYRSRADFVACNKRFSRMVLDKARGLNLLAACACWSGDFQQTRAAAYRALDIKKRIGRPSVVSNVLPYTQVNRATSQAVIEKNWGAKVEDLSRESKDKLHAFKEMPDRDKKLIDDIAAERGKDSLVAIIYSDGNAIGNKLKNVQTVGEMRAFSKEVHGALVERTETAIREKLDKLPEQYRGYRIVVDHGDEITLICNAHAAPLALDAYFDALKGSVYEACAGVAICHSHDPFSAAYRIAEQCCESGKTVNRKSGENASYVDFHYCRSGIVGSLNQIRASQGSGLTNCPYRIGESYSSFLEIGSVLHSSKVSRSDLKELNRAILKGKSWYNLEYERLKAKDWQAFVEIEKLVDSSLLAGYLFDITSFWDIYDLKFGESDTVDSNADGEGGMR